MAPVVPLAVLRTTKLFPPISIFVSVKEPRLRMMSFHSDSIPAPSMQLVSYTATLCDAGRGSTSVDLKNPDAVKLHLPLYFGVTNLHTSGPGLEIAAVALVGYQ